MSVPAQRHRPLLLQFRQVQVIQIELTSKRKPVSARSLEQLVSLGVLLAEFILARVVLFLDLFDAVLIVRTTHDENVSLSSNFLNRSRASRN